MAINMNEVGELVDRVVYINRVAKVVKGGRRFSFSALVVVGDQNGYVGVGLGKANEVPEAIRKGNEQAKKNLFKIPLDKGHDPARGARHFGAGEVLLKPACAGTGVIAGGAVRAVARSRRASSDILTKCIGTSNPHNVIHATVAGAAAAAQRPKRRCARAARRSKIAAAVKDVRQPWRSSSK